MSDESSFFGASQEVMARKLDNSEYRPIVPVLPSYKPKVSDEIQNLFDSIPIINNITSEHVEHKISDSFSNTIDEKEARRDEKNKANMSHLLATT
ncbi:25266_t:CDS:2 [Gigaspora rosea]|nr:25266_t:CDS:2 [Gigaspora rosea]